MNPLTLALGVMIALLISMLIISILGITGVLDKISSLKSRTKIENKLYTCKCGITSRKHQLGKEYGMICPHCKYRVSEYGTPMPKDDRSFPFAPKTTMWKVYIKERKEKKLAKIKEEMVNIEAYDKEVEAWENIQLKKMKEHQEKADQIKEQLERGVYEG